MGLWKKECDYCCVCWFWGDEEEEIGYLIYCLGGVWVFYYDIDGDDDDEVGYCFGVYVFIFGEYVFIKDEDGDLYMF